jgi:hypothetical protein
MRDALSGFRRLVISPRAGATALGAHLCDSFAETKREVRLCSEPEAEASVGSLVCCYEPPERWIRRAEHGALAVREHEYYVNPIAGCRSRCTYCFLQASTQRMPLRLYLGFESLFAALGELLASLPDSVEPLLCTGELADSLAESDLYPIAALLVEEVARRRRGTLELRTKSNKVETLLPLDHCGRTIVAFSLAPQEAIEAYEGGTASAAARLAAARRCQDRGYRIAIKLEPLHIEARWHGHYRELISHIKRTLDTGGIDHVCAPVPCSSTRQPSRATTAQPCAAASACSIDPPPST